MSDAEDDPVSNVYCSQGGSDNQWEFVLGCLVGCGHVEVGCATGPD